jgi:hypothetical protein
VHIYIYTDLDLDGDGDGEALEEVEDMYGAKYLPPLVRTPLSIGAGVRGVSTALGTFELYYNKYKEMT